MRHLRGRVEEVVGKRDSEQSHNLVTRIQAEKVREFLYVKSVSGEWRQWLRCSAACLMPFHLKARFSLSECRDKVPAEGSSWDL